MEPIKRKTFFRNLLLLLGGFYVLMKVPFRFLLANKSERTTTENDNSNKNIFRINRNAVKRNSNI